MTRAGGDYSRVEEASHQDSMYVQAGFDRCDGLAQIAIHSLDSLNFMIVRSPIVLLWSSTSHLLTSTPRYLLLFSRNVQRNILDVPLLKGQEDVRSAMVPIYSLMWISYSDPIN